MGWRDRWTCHGVRVGVSEGVYDRHGNGTQVYVTQ